MYETLLMHIHIPKNYVLQWTDIRNSDASFLRL